MWKKHVVFLSQVPRFLKGPQICNNFLILLKTSLLWELNEKTVSFYVHLPWCWLDNTGVPSWEITYVIM